MSNITGYTDSMVLAVHFERRLVVTFFTVFGQRIGLLWERLEISGKVDV